MRAKLKWLKEIKGREIDLSNSTYKVYRKGKEYIITRKGKCKPEKCGAICCKFISIEGAKFNKGFGKMSANSGTIIIDKKCKFLKNNRCSIFGKKDFPRACGQFPNPTDRHYWHVFGKCTFWFDVEEIKEKKGSGQK